MTIEEAISRLDRLRPNQYSCEDKVRWLSQLDHMAANEIYASHEGWQPGDFTPYTEATDTDTPLLLPAPRLQRLRLPPRRQPRPPRSPAKSRSLSLAWFRMR